MAQAAPGLLSTSPLAAGGAPWLVAAAVLIAAAALHWGLKRVGGRLSVRLARRSGEEGIAWERPAAVGLLVLRVGLWAGVLLAVAECFEPLRALRVATLRGLAVWLTAPMFVLNERHYSALDLLALPALLLGLWLVVKLATTLLVARLLRSIGVERGAGEALGAVVRYATMFLGAIVALEFWGIDASSLAIAASVLGVGIGFGLQNIANNFVSGLLLNLQRPVRTGDFLSVGDLVGTVEKIGTRCTEIRTLDHVTILVPNSRLLEQEVINWTHGDPVCRLHVPVGVAYGSDLHRVRAALLEAARGHPDVLADPRPRVEFHGFGESSLAFELLVWTREPRHQHALKSDLNYRIEANLRRQRIQIPFPQRDLHLRSPQIDRLLHAWGRRHFSEAELSAAAPGPPSEPEGGAAPSLAVDADFGPRGWSDERIDAFLDRLRGPGGVPIADRRHLLRVHPRCFVGRDAVEWMVRSGEVTRAEAVAFGRLLVERGVIHHVLDEHDFEDGNLFYRFYADEEPGGNTPPAAVDEAAR